MSCNIEEITIEGDEAPADKTGVWGYTDARGGLYGWDPEMPFPGYLIMSGGKALESKEAYEKAIAAAKQNDTNGTNRARNTARTPRAPGRGATGQ